MIFHRRNSVKNKNVPPALHAKNEVLMAALKEHGWSQNKAAKFLGISPTAIGRLLTIGQRPKRLPRELAEKLCDLTGGKLMEEIWPEPEEKIFSETSSISVQIKRSPLLPDEQCEITELLEALREAMDVLSPKQRQVIMGLFFKEETLEELSRELKMTVEGIRQVKIAALKKLRGTPGRKTFRLKLIAAETFGLTLIATKR